MEIGKNTVRNVVFTGAAILALTGCSGGESSAPNRSDKQIEATTTLPEAYDQGAAEELLTNKVEYKARGEQRDVALTAYYAAPEYSNDRNAERVENAWTLAELVTDPELKEDVSLAIDLRIADGIATSGYRYSMYRDSSKDSTLEHITDDRDLISLIRSDEVRASASKLQEYQIVLSAIDAEVNGALLGAEALLELVQDEELQKLASDVRAEVAEGDDSTKYDEFKDEVLALKEEARRADTGAWSNLYDGSNGQADLINSSIDAYEKAGGGEFAFLRDKLYDVVLKVPEVSIDIADYPSTIEATLNELGDYPESDDNMHIFELARDVIDTRVTKGVAKTAETDFGTIYDKEELAGLIEEYDNTIILIGNESVRELASSSLDLVKAKVATDEVRYGSTDIGLKLISAIKSPEIKQLVRDSIGGNSEAATLLTELTDSIQDEIDKLPYQKDIYDGSNRQAVYINNEITDFLRAS